jgi:hypothetical protein
MNKVDVHRRILITVAGMVLLSALLLIVILPGVIQDTSPGANPKIAVIAIFVIMILHLVILYGFLSAIRANKRGRPADKGLNIGLGILLLIFGLVIMDGAFAYLDHLLFVSVLMFVSVFCDFVAALITFGTLFLKPKMKN